MRILICTHELYPYSIGGIGTSAYYAIKELEKDKSNILTIISPVGPKKIGSYSLISKFGLIGILYFWFQVKLFYLHNKQNFDIVWLHQPLYFFSFPYKNCTVTFKVCFNSYNKIIQRSHGQLFLKFYYHIKSLIEKMFLKTLNKSDALITNVNSSVISDLHNAGLTKSVYLIPNGVNTTKFQPINKYTARKILNLPLDKVIFIWVGKNDAVKQPNIMVNLFNYFQINYSNIYLIMVGRGFDIASASNSNILYTGNLTHSKLVQYFSASDYLINSSASEGQPLSILEAMACGLPPILNNIAQLKTIINSTQIGCIIDVENIKESTNNIIEYLNSDKSQNDSNNARKYIIENYAWNIIIKKYLDLFKKFKRITND